MKNDRGIRRHRDGLSMKNDRGHTQTGAAWLPGCLAARLPVCLAASLTVSGSKYLKLQQYSFYYVET